MNEYFVGCKDKYCCRAVGLISGDYSRCAYDLQVALLPSPLRSSKDDNDIDYR